MKNSETFLKLSPSMCPSSAKCMQHRPSACQFIITKQTELDKWPGVEDLNHAVNIVGELHFKKLKSNATPYGKLGA